MDVHDQATRSYNMRRVRSKGTKPEEIVRKGLFRRGFRYRKNVGHLPGKPDVVLPKYHAVIMVQGCFWHGHESCEYFVLPKSNQDWWAEKIRKNKERDRMNIQKLHEMGWKVFEVWECELKADANGVLQKLQKDLQAA